MAPPRISESVKRVFTTAFTARDVAEPLTSFDAETEADTVRAVMDARNLGVVGIRLGGLVAGYADREGVGMGACGQFLRPLTEAVIVDDATPLLTVILDLNRAPFLFVSSFGQPVGVIIWGDLQKPPVRMWLFGIVTLIEMRFTELIERHCPGEAWQSYLSEGRLEKARRLLAERRRRMQSLTLMDCLQFSDKGQIIARNEEVRRLTVFGSRRRAEEAVKELEQLRNNLAHAQDILSTDWETIIQMCEFMTHL
jgi:hypothetical protein